jgi:hypothetical protein
MQNIMLINEKTLLLVTLSSTKSKTKNSWGNGK